MTTSSPLSSERDSPGVARDQVRVRLISRGPLQIKGPVELYDVDGEPIDLKGRRTVILCRCGNSRDSPFCDGSHLRAT